MDICLDGTGKAEVRSALILERVTCLSMYARHFLAQACTERGGPDAIIRFDDAGTFIGLFRRTQQMVTTVESLAVGSQFQKVTDIHGKTSHRFAA